MAKKIQGRARAPKPKPRRPYSFRLRDATVAHIDELAETRGVYRNTLIEQALEEFLRKQGPRPKQKTEESPSHDLFG